LICEDLEQIIKYPHEERWLEFKSSISWDGLKFKIIKTMLALSNIREGGYIIIGKKDDGTLEGMQQNDLDTYEMDRISTDVERYADPYVRFEFNICSFDSKSFVVFKVYEFDEIPVICKKGYQNVLRKGAVYTRSTGKPETVEVQSQTEMREILDRAATKKALKLIRQAKEITAYVENDEKYIKELGDVYE